jgi:hypothetical protein
VISLDDIRSKNVVDSFPNGARGVARDNLEMFSVLTASSYAANRATIRLSLVRYVE